ncbi:TPA: hypothetical protein N0F65_001487 [Lagenidium giganteum]|uniref:DUF268 domain-containing protein n=1 Tax=Lagenidium giganteum TaxID=4803 RepID=A0AAV2Z0Y2_9STRA|nr:TPA: hypothetical protein N0F65_001487 [Lagenidium giganteum]
MRTSRHHAPSHRGIKQLISTAILVTIVRLTAIGLVSGSALEGGSVRASEGSESQPWILRDPGFSVDVIVTPFADDVWTRRANPDQELEVLHIPSSVLNISIVMPPTANVSDARVSITLFSPDKQDPSRYKAIADTNVQYSRSYRMDVGTHATRMILRVYIEARAGTDVDAKAAKLRAFYARTLDLKPSAPQIMECAPSSKVDLHITSHPRTNMPPNLCNDYTMNGTIPVHKWYFDDQSDADKTYQERSLDEIERLITKAKARETYYYGKTDEYLFHALEKYPIRGKHVLIMGSTIPWYEAICIAFEAASCTTIDYNRLRYNHPKIQTYTVTDFSKSLTARKKYDAIFSISSFEHDGLGRYGDRLDPTADLKAMENLLQYTHPDSSGPDTTSLFLVVPVGADAVVWNAQRIYGPLRLPLLFQAWHLVESFGFQKSDFTAPFALDHQPVFVLQKPPSTANHRAGATSSEHTEL